jgi:L-iditol 2-dehydrogenase
MEKEMKVWSLHGVNDLRLETRDVPVLKHGEALIRIKSVGICGSDVHYFSHGRIGPFVVNAPMVLGHECCGEIVKAGPGVNRLKAGDHVVIEPGTSCGKCWYCKNGRYNLCPEIKFMATPPYDGCLAEYVSWPEEYLFKMPQAMSFELGALVEPFCCSVAAIRRSEFCPSASSLILGTGPIGLMVLEMLKASGAGDITVVDILKSRLVLAKQMGATNVIDATKQDVAKKVMELTSNEGAHFVFETAGTPTTYAQAPLFARNGGTVVCIGLLLEDGIPMPMSSLVINEIKLVPVFRYSNVFKEAITILQNDRVNLAPVITHRFEFEKAAEAFDFAVSQKEESVKIVINNQH